MSRPFPPLQKYLGWLQRFLYNIEGGSFPFPQPIIDVAQDWPLERQMLRAQGNTAAGGLTTLTVDPGPERHALVTHLFQLGGGAVPFPATDTCFARMTTSSGQVLDLVRQEGVATDQFPLVGGVWNTASNQWYGHAPIYVPPDWTLEVLHVSVAGGVFYASMAEVLLRPKYYPMPLG